MNFRNIQLLIQMSQEIFVLSLPESCQDGGQVYIQGDQVQRYKECFPSLIYE